MEPRWLTIIYIAVIAAHVASETTPDTLVVAKSESDKTESSGATTEEPILPIKLTEMTVTSDVTLRYAHTSVVTRVRNPGHRAQQKTFHVLLPETAFITGFAMAVSGKSYQAEVKGKEEAKKIYSEAVTEGNSAGHISARVRDSNHFTITVNVEPNSDALFNLTYEELLVRRNGVYNHAINLLPGGLVPKLVVKVNIKESQKITVLEVPEDENEADAKPFDPRKTKDSASSSELWYPHQNEHENTTGILGQFTVQYDVERPANGEIVVNDGYFAYFLAPPDLKPLSKYVVFVVDTSEGVGGLRLEEIQAVMRNLLNDLRPTDYFNIIDFHSNVKVRNISEILEDPPKRNYSWYRRDNVSELPPPTLASADNIAKAQNIVSKFDPYGGTDIYDAMDEAVDLVNKKTETIVPDSPVQISSDDLQPIIILLTDGAISVGIKDIDRIVTDVTKKNEQRKAPIYTLAFGKDPNLPLLQKLALSNNGFMRRIYPDSDPDIQIKNFYQQISSPVLAHVNFTYPPDQIREETVTEYNYDYLFPGTEYVLLGALASGATEVEPTVHAVSADDNNRATKEFKVENKAIVTEKKEFYPLERLWAYLTIKKLLKNVTSYENFEDKSEYSPEKRALALATKYGFVTPLTSLVVVKTNTTEAVDMEGTTERYTTPKYDPPVYTIGWPYPTERNYYTIGPWRPPYNERPRYTIGPYRPPNYDIPGHAFYELHGSALASGGNSGLNYGFNSHDAVTEPISVESESSDDSYNLEGYSWALSLFNRNTNLLEFSADGKQIKLELSKSSTPPKESEDSECAKSVSDVSQAGVCVYLTRCAAAKTLTPERYGDVYCVVDNKYAGVCCPVAEVDKETL